MEDTKNKMEDQKDVSEVDLSSIDLGEFAEVEEKENLDEEKIKLMEESANLKDQLLRSLAENENLRKRYEKQIEDTAKFAVSQMAKDLIDVAENFFRASENMPKEFSGEQASIMENICQGLSMTQKTLMTLLEKHGVVRINPNAGDTYDHNLHQAVMHDYHDVVAQGQITSTMQAGYQINGRLLRPAMVAVSKGLKAE